MVRPFLPAVVAPATALLALVVVAPVSSAARQAPSDSVAPLTALTVGGGPEPNYNQVAIESNVRYVDSLLPTAVKRTVLFADGDPKARTVLFESTPKQPPAAERAFEALFGPIGRKDPDAPTTSLRAPKLRSIDGPAKRDGVHSAFDSLSAASTGPVLLYFTGHGDRNRTDLDNNKFALWGDKEGLTVRDLSAELARLPKDRPVVLVMVQCFSGAFGNILFDGGSPKGDLATRPLCGFFATTRERMAAGCTPEVNEANYHDFTSYFFAALSGRDRLGHKVTPPDYNKDGRVGMDEAFAYANITEPSIDVPVATSDVFLRRFVPIPDQEVADTPYNSVLALASPAQRAALEGISKALDVTGQDRLKVALSSIRASMADSRNGFAGGEVIAARGVFADTRDDLIRRVPGLGAGQRPDSASDRSKAIAYLATRPALIRSILEAQEAFHKQSNEAYTEELHAARRLRFVRIAKSVLLEQHLRASGDAALIARFDALKALEAGNPLQSQAIATRTAKAANSSFRHPGGV